MALNKKNKKDELKGAMDDELSSKGIMGEFVNNVHDDRSQPSGKSGEKGGFIESLKSLREGSKGGFGGNFPMIRNRSAQEWWVSLAGFITVIFLVFLLFFSFGSGNKYQVYLFSNPIDNISYGSAESREVFESNKPIYVYFASKKAIKTNKIFIQVINLNRPASESKMSLIESNINPNWKIVETHFQKEFFETPGNYKIIIENEKKKLLFEKSFKIK